MPGTDPDHDHDTLDLLRAQADRYLAVLAERGVLDDHRPADLDDLFEDLDGDRLRERAREVGEPYLVTELVFRALARRGVAVGHGRPADSEWQYGRLVDRCAAVAGLDGLTCTVTREPAAGEAGAGDGTDGTGGIDGTDEADGDRSAGQTSVADGDVRTRVAIELDGRRAETTLGAAGGAASIRPLCDLLDGFVAARGDEPRRFHAVPVGEGVGVFFVEPGQEEALGSFFEMARMMRRDG
jgi:hypothetical protein